MNPYSRVYYFYDTNEEQFIVQYQNAERFGTGEYTFEVILKPDGSIIFQYETLDGVLDSSTIGIENVDGSKGAQVSYNDGYPRSGLESRSSI